MRNNFPIIMVIGALLTVMVCVPAWTRGADPKNDPGREIGRLRFEAAQKAFDLSMRSFSQGEIDLEDIYRWSIRVLNSQLDIASMEKDRTTAYSDHLSRIKILKESMSKQQKKHPKWCCTNLDMAAIEYYHQEARFFVASPNKTFSARP